MSWLYSTVRRLLPTSTQLAWSRSRIERAYGHEIAAAKIAKDYNKSEALQAEMRFELDLQREEEDGHLTRQLLHSAARLRVPVPPLHNENGGISDQWYEGSQTGGRYLTLSGIRTLRDEIRRERMERHALLVALVAGLTGVIGALAALVVAFRS
ncbi:MAG: hypothetical protein ACYCZD_03940 [Rhodanobacter sp.]